MRICNSCNNSDLKKILNLNLKVINDFKLSNKIEIVHCAKCNNYFNNSENTQEDYNDYYKFFSKYTNNGISDNNKNEKCVNYLLNNLHDKNIKTILNYGSGDEIISNLLKENYDIDNYDINMVKNINKYDCLLICHVLEHILDLNLFISKIKESLNDDGIVYIEIPNAEYYFEMKDICPLQEINLEHINFFSKFSLTKLMINHGFIPIKTDDDYFDILNQKYFVIRGIFKMNRNNLSFERYIQDGINRINKINFSNIKNLYIYGCGQFLYKLLNGNIKNCEVINIVDDNPAYLNKKIEDIEIINYDVFKNKINDNDNVLITSIINSEKIKNKLKLLPQKINIIEIFS